MHGQRLFGGGAVDELERAETVNVEAMCFGARDEAGAVLVEPAVSDLLERPGGVLDLSLLINHFVN